MGWSVPEYTRERVNNAGKILRDDNADTNLEKDTALIMINNWRTCHNFPLNTFQVRLRKKAKEIDSNSLVAQRIKRLSSIKHKLERFQNMKLTQIQDIGGCRAIMSSVECVDSLVRIYKHKQSRGVKHKLATEDDFISKPKPSGYRGVHLVYKYQSDKNTNYTDLKIEIQIRTFLQHAWATAVETVGTFIKQSLKSSQGDKDWLKFFILMSSAMAIKENRPLAPDTPLTFAELKKEIIEYEKKLDVVGHLNAFRTSLQVMDDTPMQDAHYFLLELNATDRIVHIRSFKSNELSRASIEYLEIEKRIKGQKIDAVLVSAESLGALKLAFPNYYLDTDLFLQAVKEITG